MGFLMFGGPGETRRSVLESLEFVESLALDAGRVTVGIRVYPETILATHAVQTGAVESENTLLNPTFFIEKSVQAWIRSVVAGFIANRPNWFC